MKEALELFGHQATVLSAYSAFLSPTKLPAYVRGLAALCRKRNAGYDLLWLQYTNLPDLLYLWLGKSLGMTVVVTPHLGANWRSQRSSVLRALSGWALRRADRIALLSRTQELEIKLPDNVPRSYIRLLMPAIIWDTPLPEPAGGSEVRLLHAARLSAGKGTFLFLDLCRRLQDRNIPFSARLSGNADDETMAQVRSVIAQHRLEDKVKILGWVPNSDMPALFSSSDVLVHISKIDSYPLVVLESSAYGGFPICLDLPGARDMVTTYDGHVVPDDGAVEAIETFLAEHGPQELRARGAAAAPRLRADYDWKNCIRILEEVFAASINAGRR